MISIKNVSLFSLFLTLCMVGMNVNADPAVDATTTVVTNSVPAELYKALVWSVDTSVSIGKTVVPAVGEFFWNLQPRDKLIVAAAAYVLYKVIRHAKIELNPKVSWPNGFKFFSF